MPIIKNKNITKLEQYSYFPVCAVDAKIYIYSVIEFNYGFLQLKLLKQDTLFISMD